ncbi:MAG: FG-GAP repeat domain-containing protein [Myxococcota bacterium]
MKCLFRCSLVATLYFFTTACSVSLDVPDGAVITCEVDTECPDGYVCGAGTCEQVLVNVAPTVSVRATARGAGTLPLELTIADANGNVGRAETVAVELASIIAGVRCPISTLDVALDAIATTRAGTTITTTWNAIADASPQCNLVPREVDRDGDGAPDASVLPRLAGVVVEATAIDAGGARGAPATANAELGNDAPLVTLSATPPRVVGDVPFAYTIDDSSLDPSDLDVEFALPDAPTVWRKALIKYGATASIASDGSEQVFVWDSADPVGGAGALRLSGVHLRARARDDVGGHDYGPFDEATFGVDNQTTPTIESLQLIGDDFGRPSIGYLSYRAVDEQSDPVDLRVEVSIEGEPFTTASELPTELHHGRLRLASSPRTSTGGGVEHLFAWDVSADVGGRVTTDVVLRVTPADPRAGIGNPTFLAVGARVGSPPTEASAAGYAILGAVSADTRHRVLLGNVDGSAGLDAVTGVNQGAAGLASVEIFRFSGQSTSTVPDGRFGGPVSTDITFGTSARAYALGRLDGDAYDDLVIMDSSDVALVFGSVGGFAGVTPFAGQGCDTHTTTLAIGDFNNDGQNEVALPCPGQVKIIRFSGTWQVDPTTYTVPQTAVRIAAGDVNGDDRDDLVIATAGGSQDLFDLAILPGQAGSVLLGTRQVIADDLPMNYEDGAIIFNERGVDVAAGDVDGDGVDDIVVDTSPLPTISELRVYRGGPVISLPIVSAAMPELSEYLNIADVDGDGRNEIITWACIRSGGAPCPYIHALRDGALPLLANPRLEGLTCGTAANGAAADLDGDGKAELVVNEFCSPQAGALFTYSLGGGFVPRLLDDVTTMSSVEPDSDDFSICDYDHDGALDVVSLEYLVMGAEVQAGRTNLPTATPALTTLNAGTVSAWANSPSFMRSRPGDFNGDGILDVFTHDSGVEAASIALAAFDAQRGYSLRPYAFVSMVAPLDQLIAIADVNEDGRDDVIGVDATRFLVYRSNPTAPAPPSNSWTFTAATDITTAAEVSHVALADLDRDGDLDMAAGAAGGSLYVLLGNGTGAFTLQAGCTRTTAATTVRGVAIADTADDGYPDVVVASGDGTSTTLQILNLTAGLCTTEVFTTQPATTVAGALAFPSRLVAADIDSDGIMDVTGIGPGAVITWIAHTQGGLARGFTSPPTTLSSAFMRAGIADIDRDSTADIVGLATGGDTILVAHGRQLDSVTPRAASLVHVGFSLPAVDAFGAAFAPSLLRRPYDGFGRWDEPEVVDFELGAAEAGLLAAGLRVLTRPYEVNGLTYLMRDETSVRYRVQTVYADADAAANRGVILDLPIPAARWGLDLSTGVSVVFRADDFLRAAELPGDPLFGRPEGAGVLPLDARGEPSIIRRVSTWQSVTRDADGDFATGGGRRFLVENAPGVHRVRVFLDAPGVVQAFVQ